MRRRQKSEENHNMTMNAPARHLSDSIVYLCALLADRPRLIDRYIDYFGATPRYVPRHGILREMRISRPKAG
jgi:hypothetical protein